MTVTLLHGDCIAELAAMKAAGVTYSAIVTDPPYGLAFMNKAWDAADNIAFRADTWRLALDLLEPGGMMACFGGARTQHRMAVAIEDAGFEIRDVCMWIYGSGFPKSKALLKPAYEPIILARKPGPLRKLAIDACRVPVVAGDRTEYGVDGDEGSPTVNVLGQRKRVAYEQHAAGRWPSNLLHDGSDEVLAAFAAFGASKSTAGGGIRTTALGRMNDDGWQPKPGVMPGYADTGTAARFFYAAKASKAERQGSTHCTVKPLALMRWLVRLITPAGGTVLDPFAGSGTTGVACQREGFDCVLIEREADYVQDARRRLTFNLEAAD